MGKFPPRPPSKKSKDNFWRLLPSESMTKGGRKRADFAVLNLRGRMRYGTDRRWCVADPQNPDAIVHHVWAEFAEKIIELDQKHPEVWRYTERKMILWVRPSRILDQLRCIFWARVYDTRVVNQKIKREDVLAGLLCGETWDEIIRDERNLAYLIRPIPRIEGAFESLMWRGLRHLLEWIERPRDFKTMTAEENRDFIKNVFEIIYECERRLHPPSRRGHKPEIRAREKLLGSTQLERPLLNVPRIEEEEGELVDEFDLEQLPDGGEIFGEGESGEGSDSGDGAHNESEK